MSGGVDSSLAAALLVEAGHTVVGVTLHLWDGDDPRLNQSLCCSQEIVESARRVCAQLGIDYYVFNRRREFRQHVIERFLDEYAHGRTPNPCMACNRDIKFRVLLERAAAMGFDGVATGHYARVSHAAEPQLHRAVDLAKDQSYMLYTLDAATLARVWFPLGGYTKAEVRSMASARGLASAERPESQDICFVPGGDYRQLLIEERPTSLTPGPILDEQGRELGRHAGLPRYTIGQRRGLGIATGVPVYVTELDAARNALIVAPAAALERDALTLSDVQFIGTPPGSAFDCDVQLRAHGQAVPARVSIAEGRHAHVEFAQPQRAIAPGQSAVFYRGSHVLGGGVVS